MSLLHELLKVFHRFGRAVLADLLQEILAIHSLIVVIDLDHLRQAIIQSLSRVSQVMNNLVNEQSIV